MQHQLYVAVIDGQPLFREGIVQALSSQPDFKVVGQGATYQDACWIAEERKATVVTITVDDSDLPLSRISALVAQNPALNILVLTSEIHAEHLRTAFSHGAKGCISKEASRLELVQAVRAIGEGGLFVSPKLSATLFSAPPSMSNERTVRVPEQMTYREEQILALLGQGLTNKEIARKINLQEKTVKGHITSILDKLNVNNRVQAALVAKRMQKGDDRPRTPISGASGLPRLELATA